MNDNQKLWERIPHETVLTSSPSYGVSVNQTITINGESGVVLQTFTNENVLYVTYKNENGVIKTTQYTPFSSVITE